MQVERVTAKRQSIPSAGRTSESAERQDYDSMSLAGATLTEQEAANLLDVRQVCFPARD